MAGGRPLKFNSVGELEELIEQYFDKQDERAMINGWVLPLYNLEGLAVHLNCDPKTLFNYSKKEEYFPTIKAAKNKCLSVLVDKLQLGEGSVTGAIFLAKNGYGMKDKIDIEGKTTNMNVNQTPSSAEEAANIYRDMVKGK